MATSRAAQVADDVRADILAGRFPPGEPLRIAPLCKRFDVSLSVVREALSRLVAAKLVISEPQVGFRVVGIDADHLRDLTAVRCEVEATALGWSIERGDVAWESRVVSALHTLERTPRLVQDGGLEVSEAWRNAHRGFHAALPSACGSPLLLEFQEALFDASELYRLWSTAPSADSGRDERLEHASIAEAALKRDAVAATSALRLHFTTTMELLLSSGRLIAAVGEREPAES